MDQHTLENWRKIKRVLEEAGKMDTAFYKRAVAITSGYPDPLDAFNAALRIQDQP